MNKDEFVSRLKELTPPEQSFALLGYSSDLIKKSRHNYQCKPLYLNNPDLTIRSEILDLLYSYDCSEVEIGIIAFTNRIEETPQFFVLGKVEADILALDKVTLEIKVLDHLDLDWVISSCAANGEFFLDALLSSAEFFSRRINKPELASNTALTYEYVQLCTQKAGGEKYLDFYKMLLGYDE